MTTEANILLLSVAGGNTFALLHHVRRSGFDAALEKHLRRGLAYVNEVPLPHVESTEFDPAPIEQTVREYGERFSLRLFTDEQALLWEGGRLVTVPSP